ncbi:MAG: oxidoreductase [Rhodobacterales bacterium]|nr:MAG: oxidoreductase [Rhodobacterales bacterium]
MTALTAPPPRLDFLKVAQDLLPPGASYDACVGCGLCASGCPASGLFGMDPRRFINMAMLGMNEALSTTPWVWACTQCKRCAWVCPMGIDVSLLVGEARGAWPRDEKPKGIVRSCEAQQIGDSTSAMGLQSEDFVEIIEETVEELHETQPAWAHLKAPVDKKGARFVVNQNSREPAVEPEELAPMWKIFDLVGADWTYVSKGWAAENFCMFTGDDAAWEKMVRARVEAINEIGPEYWVNTECGHSFYTLWKGIERFGLEDEARFEPASLVTLYAQWIREGKLPVTSGWNTDNLKFTVQDPCQLIRKSLGDTAAEDLRFVVTSCVGAGNFIDMAPSKSANYCCGGGGGFLQAGMAAERRAYGKRKFDQIIATEAAYVATPCHNCHSQMEDLEKHYGGAYHVTHLWTLICLALGILGPEERKYLGPELQNVNLPEGV